MSEPALSGRTLPAWPNVTPRLLTFVGIGVLTASYLSTLYWVTTVAGGAILLAAGVAVGLGVGLLLREVPETRVRRVAVGGALVAGAAYYLSSPASIEPSMVLRVLRDALVMVTGISVLRLAAVDVWVAVLVPIPVFLSTYFALRERYGLAVASGSWLVVFLALTGDATLLETLVGAVGAVLAVGFGELDRRGGSVHGAEALVALLAVMAVLALVVPVVPSGTVDPLDPNSGVSADTPIEGPGGDGSAVALDEQLLSGDGVEMAGPIELSPDVRFLVRAEEERPWRVGTLDTYTGDGWERVGMSRPYFGNLPEPPGESRSVTQQYDLRTEADAIAAASYPIEVSEPVAGRVEVTSTGSLAIDGRLPGGVNYTVESEVPDASTADLQGAGTDYPDAIERRYTRLREDTVPERVGNLTEQVTAEASTPYERAVAIERYLENTKEYSQNVSEPEGGMVDGFLFEMDAGYCTYYASAMATMLRTQDVPARVAVGYSSGQWIDDDTWVVRGTDAHAWVEVYFPEVGWVSFDPTPAAERDDARRSAIEAARGNGTATTDVPESEGQTIEFDAPPEPLDDSDDDDGLDNGTTENGTDTGDQAQSNETADVPPNQSGYSGLGYSLEENDSDVDYVEPDIESFTDASAAGNDTNATNASDGSEESALRSGERILGGLDGLVLALLIVVGSVAGGRRAGVNRRIRNASRVLWQPREDPETDAERAIDRLERVLEARYEPRRDGETWRAYRRRLPEEVDERVHRAIELHEQVRYAGETDAETVEEFVTQVDEFARSEHPVLQWLP